jgi:hypothetical protein
MNLTPDVPIDLPSPAILMELAVSGTRLMQTTTFIGTNR